ncbi:MAG: type II and III secretion system protein [Bdellovibrionales bacterium]|nr:type II and III secretion system protein [Bdellovibrionales bacterium]
MWKFQTVILLFGFLVFSAQGQPLEILQLGTSQTLNVPPDSEIRISNSRTISVVDRGRHLLITAKKRGTADIYVGNRLIRFKVLSSRQFLNYQNLQRALQGRMGLKINEKNEKLEIQGHLYRWSDWLAIAKAFQAHSKKEYSFVARVEPEIVKKAQTYFQRELKKYQLPLPLLSFHPVPTVTIDQPLKKHQNLWESVFHPFGLAINYRKVAVTEVPLIRLQVIIAEVNRTFSRTLGIDWQSEYATKLLHSPDPSEDYSLRLKGLESTGQGQILASPNLLSRSGAQAQFLAGGEVPIRLVSERSASVTWKQHGVLLKMKPLADWDGRVSIEISVEVSMLDLSKTADGIPALSTYRVSSHFDLMSGQTIALSGLIQSHLGQDQSGLPYLQSIPILGRLFSSQNYRASDSELIVFVQPLLLSNNTNEPRHMPEQWKQPHVYP